LSEIKAYGLLGPPRSPGCCAGCPHRETLSAVHSMRDQPEHKDIFAHGDIGCYSMSFLPPFGEMHNLTAMSLGGAAGSGMDPFVTNKQYALMGDSTFFWRGMTAISNSIKEGRPPPRGAARAQRAARTAAHDAGPLDRSAHPERSRGAQSSTSLVPAPPPSAIRWISLWCMPRW